MIPAVERPKGWYDPPEGIPHCDCAPCAECGDKCASHYCEHGENDRTCEHRFCVIDSCGILLKEGEDDFCPGHQLAYEKQIKRKEVYG